MNEKAPSDYKQCKLYKSGITEGDVLNNSWDTVKEFPDRILLTENENRTSILRCKECGQLYFFELIETTDPAYGSDTSYLSYLPIRSVKDGDECYQLKDKLINRLPKLYIVQPEGGASSVHWIERK